MGLSHRHTTDIITASLPNEANAQTATDSRKCIRGRDTMNGGSTAAVGPTVTVSSQIERVRIVGRLYFTVIKLCRIKANQNACHPVELRLPLHYRLTAGERNLVVTCTYSQAQQEERAEKNRPYSYDSSAIRT